MVHVHFIDIYSCRKMQNKLLGLGGREFSAGGQIEFAKGLVGVNKGLRLELATCGELADFSSYGVKHNKCVGDELIVRLFHDDAKLKDYASGVPIQISVYNDKLYVANVGSLPETWTVETLMSKHVSRSSNPTIAGCIYLTGKIETWGRGVEKVVRECRKHGCPNPQYSVNSGDPGDIMVRVGAAPDAIVADQAKSDGPIMGR